MLTDPPEPPVESLVDDPDGVVGRVTAPDPPGLYPFWVKAVPISAARINWNFICE